MNIACGCELGGDCTKTSMCALENAVEDALEGVEDLLLRARQLLAHKRSGQCANEIAAEIDQWLLENK